MEHSDAPSDRSRPAPVLKLANLGGTRRVQIVLSHTQTAGPSGTRPSEHIMLYTVSSRVTSLSCR